MAVILDLKRSADVNQGFFKEGQSRIYVNWQYNGLRFSCQIHIRRLKIQKTVFSMVDKSLGKNANDAVVAQGSYALLEKGDVCRIAINVDAIEKPGYKSAP